MSKHEVIKVCWIQHGGEAPWLKLIIDALKIHNIEMNVVTLFQTTQQDLHNSGYTSCLISPFAFDESNLITQEKLSLLEQNYGPPNLQAIVNGDISLTMIYGNNNDKKMQTVARAFLFWENYLDNNKTEYFVVRETASFATKTAYLVGKQRNIPLMRGDVGPDDNYFTMTDVDEEATWKELFPLINKDLRVLTLDEKLKVSGLVAKRVEPRIHPMDMRNGGVPWYRLSIEFRNSIKAEKRLDFKKDPMSLAELRMKRRFMLQRSVARLTYQWFPYDKSTNEKYVYLPLYFIDEGMTRVRYHYWSRNLFSLVQEVAASLPVGYTLYVKEHPGVPGDQSLKNLWKIKNIPKVKIIHPAEQSRELIRNSSAVVVLQGTAGWEAFLLQRPVIILSSNLYYSHSRLTYKVKDICDLPKILWEALKQGKEIYQHHEDEWMWFIHAVIQSSSEGCFVKFEFPFFQDANYGNAAKIAKGMAEKIHRELNKQANYVEEGHTSEHTSM